MTFHVCALPHTNVNKEHSACAFNQKVMKFCRMMKSLGHSVFLYSSEKYDAPCDKHFTCITEEERLACLNGRHYTLASFDYTLPHWIKFNQQVINNISSIIQPQDFICVIGGLAHKQIADAFPNHMTVEFGIGYGGTFAKYRVFESYAWMHTIYGGQQGISSSQGIWFDDVIPSYFDVNEFQFRDKKDDYFFFIGRLVPDKGYNIAVETCKRMNKRLLIAGPGKPPEFGEYVGVIDPDKRSELMSRAKAVFAPTTYIEPFGSVVTEAQLCGTPVITTDWGAFTETVEEEKTGFRCRSLKEFMEAVEKTEGFSSSDYHYIRERAVKLYSLETVAQMYDKYFRRLLTLWEDGWYSTQ